MKSLFFSLFNLLNFSCHFRKQRPAFLQILNQSSMLSNITPLTFSVQILYTFVKKSPLKCKLLRLSSALVKILQIPPVDFETTSLFLIQILHHSSLCITYTFKVPILRLLSALVNICQIPSFIFQTTSQCFFKFSINPHCHER